VSIAYYVNVTVHVLSAMLWLGGMLFLGLVGAPVLRAVEPAELRQRLFSDLGRRFRTVGWVAIALLIITGIGNLHFRGLQWSGVLGASEFWRTTYGVALAVKLAGVTAMIAISAVHDFIIGPRAVTARPGSSEAQGLRRQAALIARINAIVALLVVIAAVRLAR
jgi:putative copper export protein